ncbi:hypothetical protein ARMGADRAFT_562332 [Armillaria gallica]|uniref:Uncharacterized protein n=1 Tax=Armillaria gallica TaxID=47427 RepID=A0A2H3CQI4_ARMGA|nr:hypothetical protein ARMGADRAFT_562332 [Armillaria gallica]
MRLDKFRQAAADQREAVGKFMDKAVLVSQSDVNRRTGFCSKIFDCRYIVYHLQCIYPWTRARYVINFASLHDNGNPCAHQTIAYRLTTRRHKRLPLLKTRGSPSTSRRNTGSHPCHYNIVLHGENLSFFSYRDIHLNILEEPRCLASPGITRAHRFHPRFLNRRLSIPPGLSCLSNPSSPFPSITLRQLPALSQVSQHVPGVSSRTSLNRNFGPSQWLGL